MNGAEMVPIASVTAGSALFCAGGLTPLGPQAVVMMLGGIALIFFGLGARKAKGA